MGMLTDQSLESGCINKTSLSRMPQLGMFTDQSLESESLLAGCVVSGQSGGSRTVGILRTLFVGCVCTFRTVRRIPDCRDPPDTVRGLCTFRTVRRIPDCQDPPDTLLVGCVVSGQSGGSQTVGILRTLCLRVVYFQDSQEDPRLSGSSGHSAYGLCSFRTVRRIPDCRDPPDTIRGLCTFRTVRRIPDCRDPPDTLLVGCVVSGQSGGSQTVGILQTLFVGCVLSGQSGDFRTDPPDTLLVGCVVSGQSEGSQTVGILPVLLGLL